MMLSRRDHEVTVIDHVGSSFSHLDPAWRGRTIEAEAMAEGVLDRAGIAQAQGLASVTNSDAVNAVVAHVARTVYKVPNVVSRNYDPRWRPLHEAMGLQMVSSTAWGAQRWRSCWSRRMRPVLSATASSGLRRVPPAWSGRRPTVRAFPVVSLTRGGRATCPGERAARRRRLQVGPASAPRGAPRRLWEGA
jgi:trk system potassium uptake protein TrkA